MRAAQGRMRRTHSVPHNTFTLLSCSTSCCTTLAGSPPPLSALRTPDTRFSPVSHAESAAIQRSSNSGSGTAITSTSWPSLEHVRRWPSAWSEVAISSDLSSTECFIRLSKRNSVAPLSQSTAFWSRGNSVALQICRESLPPPSAAAATSRAVDTLLLRSSTVAPPRFTTVRASPPSATSTVNSTASPPNSIFSGGSVEYTRHAPLSISKNRCLKVFCPALTRHHPASANPSTRRS